MTFRRIAAVPIVLMASSLAVALSACSGSSSSGSATATAPTSVSALTPSATPSALDSRAAQLLAATEKAVAQATSVHVSGSMGTGTAKVALDLSVSRADGGAATGTLTIHGDKVTVRRLGSALYLKTGAKFWVDEGSADPSSASQFADRWIKASESEQDFADFFDLASVNGLTTAGISISDAETSTLRVVDGKTIGGTATVGLFDPKSSAGDKTGTLYVASKGATLPLEIDGSGTKVTYTDWNQPVTVSAPVGALDLSRS